MTNYEKIMAEMTVEKLAYLMDGGLDENTCRYCTLKDDPECGCMCQYGISEWLQKETKESEQ